MGGWGVVGSPAPGTYIQGVPLKGYLGRDIPMYNACALGAPFNMNYVCCL